jgi:hypothetical protein
MALAPIDTFIVEFDQIEGFEDLWAKANTDIAAYLPYHSKATDGQLVPAPQRNQAEPPIQAFVSMLKLADENLKSTFSIFDASLGERGPQESGIAINSRKIESDQATYDWIDNFTRSLTFLGIVLDDLLEHYYNTPGRIVQIIQEDLSQKPVVLNQTHQGEDGQPAIYDLSKGKFGITISTGPSFATRRQEAAKSMLDVSKVYPALWQIAGPRMVKAMDWPQKDAIAAQLEKAQPPELREQDPNAQPNPQELQQNLSQMQAMVQKLSEALHAATDQTEREKQKEEWATYRSQMTNQTMLAIADLKTGSQEAQALMLQEFGHIRAALEAQLLAQNQQNSTAPASAASPTPAPAPAQAAPAGPPAGSVPPQ